MDLPYFTSVGNCHVESALFQDAADPRRLPTGFNRDRAARKRAEEFAHRCWHRSNACSIDYFAVISEHTNVAPTVPQINPDPKTSLRATAITAAS
jgi:hypothetical protein